jgi:hypothetical protein
VHRRGDHQNQVSGQIVNFRFTDFIQSDYQVHENNVETPARRGYIVYNDRRKDFGFGTFGSSDSYTIDYDVLNQIRVMHTDFIKDIIESGGFLINGVWHPVNSEGNLVRD